MKNIRILFLGDEGVGKTSIISTIMSETFPKNPPKKIPPVCIPPDVFVQYKDINTLLLDSSSDTTDEEIQKASVILLVYDVMANETITRLETYWLPKVTDINEDIPIILVGNKIDMRSINIENELERIITPLIMKFKQVEMGIECSAKAYLKLIDVVFCAQRAVLFPIAPLQDPITKELKPEYEKALLRIFRICDKDFDGYLDEWEINEMQTSVFNGELQSCHIEGLKEFLRQECGEDKYSREDSMKGINFEAFKCLNTIFIKKMKLQTCWLILEHYGYNEKLRISDEHLVGNDVLENEANNEWEGVEISDICLEYLVKLFNSYCNQEGNLDSKGLEDLFQTTLDGCPWNIQKEAKIQKDNTIDKRTWIGLWQKIFSENYAKAYELLVYLGFCESFANAVDIKIEREKYLLSESTKEVFNCFLIGNDSVGKTAFLEMLLNERFPDEIDDDSQNRSVVLPVEVANKSKYLIISEFKADKLNSSLFDNPKRTQFCDVFCLMHDGTEESSKFIFEIQQKLPKRIPKVLIKTKMDIKQKDIPLEEIANEIKTSQYIEISSKNLATVKDAIDMISFTAFKPAKGLEKDVVEKLKEEYDAKKKQEQNKILLIGGISIISICGLAFVAKKYELLKPIFDYFKS